MKNNEEKNLTPNPALEKGIDYCTSALRALKAQRAELKLHRDPTGSGFVNVMFQYDAPSRLMPLTPPAADTHDPGD